MPLHRRGSVAGLAERQMKQGKLACLLILPVLLLAGCAGFWQNPATSSSTGGCTSDCTTATSGSFYILVGGSTPQIQGESFVTGKLTAITGSPWNLTAIGVPNAMTIAPKGNYLYVSTASGIFMYPISGGALGNSTQVSQDAALAIAVDPSGAWLIDAEPDITGANVLMGAIPLDPSTGVLPSGQSEIYTKYSVSNLGVQPGQIAISTDDAHVFVALGAGGVIAVPFTASVNTGVSPFGANAPVIAPANSGSALSVAVDPGGKLFYIGETLAAPSATTGGLRVFTISSLAATPAQISGSPIASGGSGPHAILPLSTGYVYVANWNGTSVGNISAFSIAASASSPATYTIAATGSSASTGGEPVSMTIDATDTFLLDVNASGNPYFNSYTFDTTTPGKLDPQITANTGASPLAIVAAP